MNMSRFYGTVDGAAETTATRRGHQSITTKAAGWSGAIQVDVYDVDGQDHYLVSLTPWMDSGGGTTILCEGTLDAAVPPETCEYASDDGLTRCSYVKGHQGLHS